MMPMPRKALGARELWKSEVLARLKEPWCWICAHSINEANRDFFWFINEQYYEIGVIDKMRLAYGFCPSHTRQFLQTGAHSVNVTVFSYLTWYVITRLNAARELLVHGGSKQDPRRLCGQAAAVLRPRRVCPMCESIRTGEQTNLHVLLTTLALPEIRDAYESSAGLCVPHFRQAGRRAEWDTLVFLASDIERKLQAKLLPGSSAKSVLEQTAGLDKERRLRCGGSSDHPVPACEEKQGKLEMYIDLGNPTYPWSPSFDQMLSALAEPGCPVCRACNVGLEQYLGWLAREMDTQAWLSNGWDLSYRTCPAHLWELHASGHERAASAVADHMVQDWLSRLQRMHNGLNRKPSARSLQRLGEAFRVWCGLYDSEPLDSEARAQSRRKKVMAVIQSPQQKLDDIRVVAFGGENCQACTHIETTATRTLELILRVLEDPAGRKAYHEGWGLCLKHCVQAAGLADVPAALTELLSAQIGRLRVLEWDLHEASRKDNWSVRYEPKGTESQVWRRAAYQFCGV